MGARGCDAFWSRSAEIMAWFLVITHNRVKEEDSTPFFPPTVDFEIKRNDDDVSPGTTLYQSYSWQKRVYTPSRESRRFGGSIPEEQSMVENHEDYYQGCVMHMIQR